jgi:beta-lactamase class A
MLIRRTFIAAGAASIATTIAGVPPSASPFALLADQARVRLGVCAIHTGTGRRIGFRANERFAMCSTFKLPLAALVLHRADERRLELEHRVHYRASDIPDAYAPATKANLARGWMTISELCGAAISLSDNGAANLLLAQIGGPASLTQWLRSTGDVATRLDRNEPLLNRHVSGDPRDTTTPAAMAQTAQRLLLGKVLSPSARDRLASWLIRSQTGGDRLRAGLPSGWRVGDKTGTGSNHESNDVAIVWPPQGPPILIASYIDGGSADDAARNKVHSDVARLVTQEWALGAS